MNNTFKNIFFFLFLAFAVYSCKRDVKTEKAPVVITQQDLIGEWKMIHRCIYFDFGPKDSISMSVDFEANGNVSIWDHDPRGDTAGWSTPFATGTYSLNFVNDSNFLSLDLLYDTSLVHDFNVAPLSNTATVKYFIQCGLFQNSDCNAAIPKKVDFYNVHLGNEIYNHNDPLPNKYLNPLYKGCHPGRLDKK